jgi:hypothetical protein
MTTSLSSFKINGVIDTNDTVLANLQKIASAACSWLTYDIQQGKWCVVINTTDTSVASFNDSNIIGGINITSTGLTELYNSVEIEFPHVDIKDRKDYIRYDIPAGNRFANEPDNALTISTDIVNDPMQAAAIAIRELKQSRVDKAIEFRTDYSKIGLKAGDLIDITNSVYSYTSKVFRIIKVSEEDSDDGNFYLSISALEYDAAVYDTSGLIRTDRTVDNGIINQNNNAQVQDSNEQNWASVFGRMLLANAVTGLLNMAFSKDVATGKAILSLLPKSQTRDDDIVSVFDNGNKSKMLKAFKPPSPTITGPTSVCEGSNIVLTIGVDCSNCLVDYAAYTFNYTITGVQAGDISFPLTGTCTTGTVTIPTISDGATENETLTFTIGSVSKAVIIQDALAFTYVTTASPASITEGASSTVTLATTGLANGTVVPYTITGSGTSRVSTALTGNVTISSNSATLVVNTIDDSTYTGTQSVTVTFNDAQADACGQLDKTAAISILDNDAAPTVCQTVSIPVVWCPIYNGTTGQVIGLTVSKYATVQAPVSGGATVSVPTSVSVTAGSPSTVTVTSTASIDATANKAGQDFKVITTFNSIPVNGVVTGTTTTVTGY